MSDSSVLIENRPTLTFFQKLKYRFQFGDSPTESTSIRYQNPRFANLLFELHPGPLERAFQDASDLNKHLLIYIYFDDNEFCQKFEKILKDEDVAYNIRRNYVFYPVSITSVDGIQMASQYKFRKLPIVRRCTQDQLFDTSPNTYLSGDISESTFLELISIPDESSHTDMSFVEYHHPDPPPELVDNGVNTDRNENQIEYQQEHEKKLIQEAYEQLPQPDTNEECYTIKFRFPDNTERIHKFPLNAANSMLFIFVRYFMFPQEFTLECGFPSTNISDSDDLIETIANGKNFMIFVTIND